MMLAIAFGIFLLVFVLPSLLLCFAKEALVLFQFAFVMVIAALLLILVSHS